MVDINLSSVTLFGRGDLACLFLSRSFIYYTQVTEIILSDISRNEKYKRDWTIFWLIMSDLGNSVSDIFLRVLMRPLNVSCQIVFKVSVDKYMSFLNCSSTSIVCRQDAFLVLAMDHLHYRLNFDLNKSR